MMSLNSYETKKRCQEEKGRRRKKSFGDDSVALLLHLSGKVDSPLLALLEILLRRLEDDRERVERDAHAGLELEETALDVLDALARPAVGAKDAREEAAVDDGVDAADDVPHRRECLTDEGRRAEEETLGLADGLHDLAEVGVHEVEHLDVDAVLLERGLDGAGHRRGELVRRGVRDDHERVARARDGRGPVAVKVKIVRKVLTKNRTMAAANGLKVKTLQTVKTLQHIGLEGAKDAVKVVAISTQHVCLHCRILGDLVVEHKRVAVMSTKEVTRDNGLELRDESDHGVRPVEEWADDELECVSTNVNGLSLACDCNCLGELGVADELDVAECLVCCHDGCIGITSHEECEGATVVGLGVVEDNEVDLLARLEDRLDAFLKLGKVCFLDSLEEHICLGALEEEAVVSCSEGCVHDDVENPQCWVESPNPEEVLLDVQCLCHLSWFKKYRKNTFRNTLKITMKGLQTFDKTCEHTT